MIIVPSRPSSPESIHRHSRYYLQSGNIILRVADVLFRLWDEPFRASSRLFQERYFPLRAPFGACIGTDDEPIVIDGVRPYEFDRFLGVIFPPFHRGASSFFSDYHLDDWLAVLKLATAWEFPGVREIALDRIGSMHLSNIDIAILGESHPLPGLWRVEALTYFVEREEPISVEEGKEFGGELTTLLFTAREILGEEGRRNGESVKYVIREMFDLSLEDSN
ncbi:hypothetical protein AX15_004326 [Amanita polypyramis BW_CC]|nr:hypothetical protein AX15_004326 [Amanita polypyramis BW_CC]